MKALFARLTFDNDRLFYFALALAVAPIWLFKYLPGVDLPAHAAQIAALHEIWRGNPVFTELFSVNLLTPYLTATALGALLAYVMPINVAVKLMLTFVMAGTPVLFSNIAKATGSNHRWRWLVIPSIYSFAFYWGFFPFLFAVPLGLLLVWFTVRFNEQPSLARAFIIAIYSVFLFVSHLLVLCYSSMLALAWIVGSNLKTPLRCAKLVLPFTAPLPLIALWLSTSLQSGTYVSSQQMFFGPMLFRLRQLITQPSGIDGEFLFVAIAVTAVIIFLPLLSKARFTKSPAKWTMALCGFAVFMTFPATAMGTAYLYLRFGLYLPFLWLLLWEKGDAETGRYDSLGMIAVAVSVGIFAVQLSGFNTEAKGFDKIVEHIEPGSRVASLPVVNRGEYFEYPSYLHFPSWYQSQGRGVIDFNFGLFYGTMVIYKDDKRPAFNDTLTWLPMEFQWDANGGDNYDYFIVHANIDVSKAIFKGISRKRVELIAQEGWWWLYRRIGSESISPR